MTDGILLQLQPCIVITAHIILDFYKADPLTLAKTEELQAAIDRALASIDVVACNDNYIQFEPQGVTATVVTPSFHFSIHTWPEYGSCAVDLYSSKEPEFARIIANELKKEFQAGEYDLKVIDRTVGLRIG